jgi:Uma2 family endonuclease
MTVAATKVTDLPPLDISTLHFTAEQFKQLCASNPDRSLELTTEGALIITPPVGGGSGKRELSLGSQIHHWNEETGLGEAFSSSTIFTWVERSRWESLTLEEQEEFPPLAPDFVIELRSQTDSWSDLQKKMLEYRDNGVKLG